MSSRWRSYLVLLCFLLSTLALALSLRATQRIKRIEQQQTLSPIQFQRTPAHSEASNPIAGAHYFGREWAKNAIGAFRNEDVKADFSELREDGFNAVIWLVAWGDFQPNFEPCCAYDERAFERLAFLLKTAKEEKLNVILRVGFAWTFHPNGGDSHDRVHRLVNDASVRVAYFEYMNRMAELIRQNDHIVASFISWEDLYLQRIDESARQDFVEFVAATSPKGMTVEMAKQIQLPEKNGTNKTLFNQYWDWLILKKFIEPLATTVPGISLEARIDREPLARPNTQPVQYDWIDHFSTYRPLGVDTTTIYWAPFWGARNEGEKLEATQSLKLFSHLLNEVRSQNEGRAVFIDQFNVIDNTPGFERNAVLATPEVPKFLNLAQCAMQKEKLKGYAFWTARDYAESSLYNPSFSFGLEGWSLETQGVENAESRLIPLATGDNDLQLLAGDKLSQKIPAMRGRIMQATDAREDIVCLRGSGAATVEFGYGDGTGAKSQKVDLKAGFQCTPIQVGSANAGEAVRFSMRVAEGSLRLKNIKVTDHIQVGGIRKLDGSKDQLWESARQMNVNFITRNVQGCAN